MRKLYRGTNPYGYDSLFYVRDEELAFMFWPEGMSTEQIKTRLEEAEKALIYVGVDYLEKIEDLQLVEEW